MNLKTKLIYLLALLILSYFITTAVYATEIGVKGGLKLSTDQLYRGISMANNDFSAQAGIEFYMPIHKNIETFLGSKGMSVYRGTRFNTTGGLRFDFEDYFSEMNTVTIGARGSMFTANSNMDFYDLFVTLDHFFVLNNSFLTNIDTSFRFTYTPNMLGNEDLTVYYPEISNTLHGPLGMKLTGHAGYNLNNTEHNYDSPSYVDYNVSVSKKIIGLNMSVGYFGNTLTHNACNLDVCDNRVMASVGYRF